MLCHGHTGHVQFEFEKHNVAEADELCDLELKSVRFLFSKVMSLQHETVEYNLGNKPCIPCTCAGVCWGSQYLNS